MDAISLMIGLAAGTALGAAAAVVVMLLRRGALAAELANARARAEMLSEQSQRQADEAHTARMELNEANRAREGAERARVAMEQQLKAREQQFAEQKQLLDEAQQRLKDAFRAVGAEALAANNRQFIELAAKTFEKLMSEAKGDVEKKQQAIDALVKPIRELLEKQTTALTEIEKKRLEDKTGLQEQLRQIAEAHRHLSQETGQLVKALRRPEQRGRWGEMQLRNCVELAGMTSHCDFLEQATIGSDGARLRPDMFIKLPGEGLIVVDAKVALDAYLDAIECRDDETREECLRRHAKQIAAHIDGLRSKSYWDHAESLGKRAPKLVVMFVPLESALVAALEVQPELHSSAMTQHVLIATPTLLVALLRAVAYGWRQEDVAANAREISIAGQELYDRLAKFVEHFERVGKNLNDAGRAYDSAIGSLESRILPSARRLRELHATTQPEIETPAPLQIEARRITAAELLTPALDGESRSAPPRVHEIEAAS